MTMVMLSDFFNSTKKDIFGYDESLDRIICDQAAAALRQGLTRPGYRVGVVLVPLHIPDHHIHSRVVLIDENTTFVTTYESRVPGETPRKKTVALVRSLPRAKYLTAVLYRWNVLAEDNARSGEAEWEVVALLAQVDAEEPMSPFTLMANHFKADGGTATNMTPVEFEAALRKSYDYWKNRSLGMTFEEWESEGRHKERDSQRERRKKIGNAYATDKTDRACFWRIELQLLVQRLRRAFARYHSRTSWALDWDPERWACELSYGWAPLAAEAHGRGLNCIEVYLTRAPNDWDSIPHRRVGFRIDGRNFIDIADEAGAHRNAPVMDSDITPLENSLYGRPEYDLHEDGRTILQVCSCGEPACYSLGVRILVQDTVVVWHDFASYPDGENQTVYTRLGPFVFDRRQYDAAISDVVQRMRASTQTH